MSDFPLKDWRRHQPVEPGSVVARRIAQTVNDRAPQSAISLKPPPPWAATATQEDQTDDQPE